MKKETRFVVVSFLNKGYILTIDNSFTNPILYYSTKPYTDKNILIGPFKGNQMWIKSPSLDSRIYFLLKSDNQKPVWSATTSVEMTSINNLRDLGGYKTKQNKTVKWGKFFRSAWPGSILEKESIFFDSLKIKHFLDYRTSNETSFYPYEIADGAFHHKIPALDESSPMAKFASITNNTELSHYIKDKNSEDLIQSFFEMYRILPFKNPAFSNMFSLLDKISSNNKSLLQHCSAGKDRTGVGSALLLRALDVDKDTIMGDYLLSSLFRNNSDNNILSKLNLEDSSLKNIIGAANILSDVSTELLNESFSAIEDKYSNYDDFFLYEYNIKKETLLRWRELYTV